jgi:hypothetical protein
LLAEADHDFPVDLERDRVAIGAGHASCAPLRSASKQRSIEKDASFGGALRRLRLQRGLRREDFDGISAKEIARIERGEVAKPHADTLATLAARFGVKPEEIETF